MPEPKTVVCGIIWKGDELLVAQRKSSCTIAPDKWEFPGGKQEPGETLEHALEREIREELGLEVKVRRFYAKNSHTYDRTPALGPFSLDLYAYEAIWVSGEITIIDCQDAKWEKLANIGNYDFAVADVPFVEKLQLEYS